MSKKGGRPTKIDPAKHRYVFYLNDKDNSRFLALFEQSGMKTKSHFIVARIFNESFKVIQINKSAVDYYSRLTTFYAQFRAIGVNYNQVVKALKANFSDKKALAFLFKLEKATIELAKINQKVIELTREFEAKYLEQ